MSNDPLNDVAYASLVFRDARRHLHEAIQRYNAANMKAEGPSGKRPKNQRKTPKAARSAKMEKQKPLGSITRVVVRSLLATGLLNGQEFTMEEAKSLRNAPHNTRDGVFSCLQALVRRGLLKDHGQGKWSIFDRNWLEDSLSWT